MECCAIGATQDDDFKAGARVNNFDVQGESEIYFKGETTLDNGMLIGVMVQLEAGSDNNATAGEQDVIDESYMYVSGKYGKLILGSTDNVAHQMRATAPKFYGLQGGITYASSNDSSSDDQSARSETIAKATAAGPIEEAWAFGLAYERTIGPVGLLLSGGYTIADLYNGATNTNNMGGSAQDFSGGLSLTYGGFTLGGSVRCVLESFTMDATTNPTGWAWDTVLMYAEGPCAVSLSYRSAETQGSAADRDKDTVAVWALGGKYAPGTGVDLFAQLATADYSDKAQSIPAIPMQSVENKARAVRGVTPPRA